MQTQLTKIRFWMIWFFLSRIGLLGTLNRILIPTMLLFLFLLLLLFLQLLLKAVRHCRRWVSAPFAAGRYLKLTKIFSSEVYISNLVLTHTESNLNGYFGFCEKNVKKKCIRNFGIKPCLGSKKFQKKTSRFKIFVSQELQGPKKLDQRNPGGNILESVLKRFWFRTHFLFDNSVILTIVAWANFDQYLMRYGPNSINHF